MQDRLGVSWGVCGCDSITHTGSDHEPSRQSIYESISYHDLISGRGGEEEEEEGKGVMFNSGPARHTITPLTSYDSWSAHLPTDPWPNMNAFRRMGGGREVKGRGGVPSAVY